MISVKVTGDTRALTRHLTEIQRKHIVPAQNHAINRTAQAIMTRGRRESAQELGIAQKHLSNRIYLRRSNFRTLRASISAYLRPIKLFKLTGAAGIKREPGSFVATMPGGHMGIFRLKPNARTKISPNTGKWTQLPIEEVVIKVAATLERHFNRLFLDFAPEEYKRVFARELQRRIDQAARRLGGRSG